MSHVAEDVVSYEHDAPLAYRGADGVREVCLRGFEAAQGEFTWSIPDLTVVVRGDIAVTWVLTTCTPRAARTARTTAGRVALASFSGATVAGRWSTSTSPTRTTPDR